MSDTFPLITRQPNDHIAYLTKPIEALNLAQGVINTNQFLAHICIVAENLPATGYAINLCENRYLFLVALCAAIVRKDITLLPPNKNIATQKVLSSKLGGREGILVTIRDDTAHCWSVVKLAYVVEITILIS